MKGFYVFISNYVLSQYPYDARMSKITNDGLTLSGTECFTAVPIWQQWTSKGYSHTNRRTEV